jgi:two-component system OmpR family response regulator
MAQSGEGAPASGSLHGAFTLAAYLAPHMPSPAPTRRILVVEDDPKVAGLLAEALGEEGHAVEVVGDGHLAAERALAQPWDLILLDYMLPGRDGPGIAAEVRAAEGPAGRRTPILMLSARDAAEDVRLGRASGADDYLAKPFRLGELLRRVDALLERAS